MKLGALIKVFIPIVFMFMAAQAQALLITPGQAIYKGTENNVPDMFDEIFTLAGITLNDPIYKAEVGDTSTGLPVTETGVYQMFYDTTFDNDPWDPSEATISHVDGTPFIDSSPAYLLVKDGKHEPAWYLFDLTATALNPLSWNGTDSLQLSGFWPAQGAISHVALFADTSPVPEPATMLLFGTGLVGLVGSRLRRKKKAAN